MSMCNALLTVYENTTDPAARTHLARALRRMVYVETLGSLPITPKVDKYALTPDEVKFGQTVGKIQLIKAYRERTGLGLKECKDNCEAHFQREGLCFKGYDRFGQWIGP